MTLIKKMLKFAFYGHYLRNEIAVIFKVLLYIIYQVVTDRTWI